MGHGGFAPGTLVRVEANRPGEVPPAHRIATHPAGYGWPFILPVAGYPWAGQSSRVDAFDAGMIASPVGQEGARLCNACR